MEEKKMTKNRDYRKEYDRDHSSKRAKLDRAARNRARRSIRKLPVGDPREVDHKRPLSKGGSRHSPGNLRIMTRTANRKKGDR